MKFQHRHERQTKRSLTTMPFTQSSCKLHRLLPSMVLNRDIMLVLCFFFFCWFLCFFLLCLLCLFFCREPQLMCSGAGVHTTSTHRLIMVRETPPRLRGVATSGFEPTLSSVVQGDHSHNHSRFAVFTRAMTMLAAPSAFPRALCCKLEAGVNTGTNEQATAQSQ